MGVSNAARGTGLYATMDIPQGTVMRNANGLVVVCKVFDTLEDGAQNPLQGRVNPGDLVVRVDSEAVLESGWEKLCSRLKWSSEGRVRLTLAPPAQ